MKLVARLFDIPEVLQRGNLMSMSSMTLLELSCELFAREYLFFANFVSFRARDGNGKRNILMFGLASSTGAVAAATREGKSKKPTEDLS